MLRASPASCVAGCARSTPGPPGRLAAPLTAGSACIWSPGPQAFLGCANLPSRPSGGPLQVLKGVSHPPEREWKEGGHSSSLYPRRDSVLNGEPEVEEGHQPELGSQSGEELWGAEQCCSNGCQDIWGLILASLHSLLREALTTHSCPGRGSSLPPVAPMYGELHHQG